MAGFLHAQSGRYRLWRHQCVRLGSDCAGRGRLGCRVLRIHPTGEAVANTERLLLPSGKPHANPDADAYANSHSYSYSKLDANGNANRYSNCHWHAKA